MAMASSYGVSFISISLTRSFSCYPKNKLFEKCNEFFIKNSTKDLNGLLDEVSRGPKPEMVFDLIKDLSNKGFICGEHTLGILMKSSSRLSDHRIKDGLLGICLKQGEWNNQFIINSYLKNNAECESLFRKFVSMGYKPTIMTHNFLLSSYCLGKNIEKALDMFHEMKSVAKTYPNLMTYGILICCLCRENRPVDEALGLLKEMVDVGLCPNDMCITPVIKSLLRFGRFREVDEFVLDRKFACGVSTYNVLLDHFARKGKIERVLTLFQQMVKRGIEMDLITFNTLLRGYSEAKDVIGLTQVYKVINDLGLTPNTLTINTLLNGLAKNRHLDEALGVFRDISDGRLVAVDVYTYVCLIQVLFKEGRTEEAMDLYLEMQNRGIKETDFSLGVYVEGMCTNGRVEEALLYVTNLKDRRVKPNDIVFNTLLQGTSRLGLYKETFHLFKELVQRGYVVNDASYRALCDYESYGYNLEKVIGELCGAGIPLNDAYNNFCLACFEKGHHEDASWLIKEMVQKDIPKSEAVVNHMRKTRLQF